MNITSHIQFNPWKHHAGFIKEQIDLFAKEKDGMNKAKESIKVIGDSLMDLYVGRLSVDKIFEKVALKLEGEITLSSSNYANWINNSGTGYQIITLQDKSHWVLRIGDDNEKYIHIHPAKYSPHTVRVRAKTLKTAILVSVYEKNKKIDPLDLQLINKLRKEYLNEPPMKSVSPEMGLGEIIVELS